jgi:hypothetical protein
VLCVLCVCVRSVCLCGCVIIYVYSFICLFMWMGGQNVSQGSWWPKAGERYQQQVGHVQDLGLFD